MLTIQQAFDLALQRHQAGRLREAEHLYRQVLGVQPNHVESLQLLGLLAHQVGNSPVAVELLTRALALHPQHYIAQGNLAEAYRAMGRYDDAMACYRRALQVKPDNAQTHFNLGNALGEMGQLDAAVAAYHQAVTIDPGYADAYNNLGVTLARLERFEEAIAIYRQILQLRPNHPEAHNNLGIALAERGHWEEAMAEYRQAIALQPGYPEAYNNLGNALNSQGRVAEAMAAYRRALELQPNYPEARGNLGIALTAQGRFAEAVAESEQAIRLQPAHADAHNNLGIALAEQGRLDEAIAVYERLIQLHPRYADAYMNLGNALKDQGRVEEALKAYRRTLEIQPADARALSNLIYTLLFVIEEDDVICKEQERWQQQISLPARRFIRRHENAPDPERPLRIGYVSADLRDHVVGRNLLPLFRHHDHERFQIFCYASIVRPDALTEEFQARSDGWRNVFGSNDEALAGMIRTDGIDILVDLAQHTAGNRLPMFAREPAPLQVSFAGYPASAGVESIRHRISDRYLDGETKSSGEQIHFIDSFWCYDPCGMNLTVSALPAESAGDVTFGSLNNFCKVTEPVLRLWGRVLAGVKDSRLMIMSAAASHRERVLAILRGEGIEGGRVEFVEPRGRAGYLELYHRMDLMLDTFPYNGHTTSLDALWMGVPVVSLAGASSVARAGFSQLSNLSLPELVAWNADEFTRIATQLGQDRPRLAGLRRALRARMETSVLMDAPRFARGIESAYRAMWRQWCAQGVKQ